MIIGGGVSIGSNTLLNKKLPAIFWLNSINQPFDDLDAKVNSISANLLKRGINNSVRPVTRDTRTNDSRKTSRYVEVFFVVDLLSLSNVDAIHQPLTDELSAKYHSAFSNFFEAVLKEEGLKISDLSNSEQFSFISNMADDTIYTSYKVQNTEKSSLEETNKAFEEYAKTITALDEQYSKQKSQEGDTQSEN